MTADNDKSEVDHLVRRAYRELGREKAPEHLNQTILQKAATADSRNSANRFSVASWTKPLAWAATIGLSLAIVMELTQAPTKLESAAPASRVISEETATEDVAILSFESKKSVGASSQPAAAASRPLAKMQPTTEPAAMERAQAEMSDLASECDVTIQEAAEDWMECIRNLRETGATEQADREYEAFLLIYPAE